MRAPEAAPDVYRPHVNSASCPLVLQGRCAAHVRISDSGALPELCILAPGTVSNLSPIVLSSCIR